MSRLFKKIQNATNKVNENINQGIAYSNINRVHTRQYSSYGIIVCTILFLFGGLMSYLIVDNIDCFYTAFSSKSSKNIEPEKKVVEPINTPIEESTAVAKEENKISKKHKNTISLSQCMKKWMSKKLQNPILQKENIVHVVNELSSAVSESDAPIKDRNEVRLTTHQQEHLRCVNDFLKRFQIECVRVDGIKSRVQANGRSYMVNTIVSQYPKLRLSMISNGEIIFTDENNKEYRKEISQYD